MKKHTPEELRTIMRDAANAADSMAFMMRFPEAHLQILATEYVACVADGKQIRDPLPHLITLMESILTRIGNLETKINGLLTPNQ